VATEVADPRRVVPGERAGIVAAIVISVLSMATFLVMPVVVGASVADLGLSDAEVGALGAAVAGGVAVSAACMMFVVRRLPWRLGMRLALLAMVLANALSMLVTQPPVFMLLQFVAALGGGTAYALALTLLSDSRQPDRFFGFSVAAQVAFQVLGMIVLSELVARFGLDALLLVFVLLQALAVWLARYFPQAAGLVAAARHGGMLLRRPAVLLTLGGCLFFFFNVGAVWTYLERVAAGAGFDAATTGWYLALGVACGIPGALLAAWCGDRAGRLLPLALGTAGTVGALLLLEEGMSAAAFGGGVALYNLAWNFSLAFQYAAVNAVDTSGRAVAAAPAFHGVGGALGPAVAGALVGAWGLAVVDTLAIAAVLLSLASFALGLHLHKSASGGPTP
jgi:MFS transporter, DHA1 family, inner membrane transport protein